MKPSRGVLGFALMTTACSTSYQPVNSPRISFGLGGGILTLWKDGHETSIGLTYGGVLDAVRGNPRAEAEARTAQNLMIGGVASTFVSLGALITGLVLVPSKHQTTSDVGGGLIVGGIVADIVGAVLVSNGAQPHMYDAINIYNDGLPPPGYGLPSQGVRVATPFAPPKGPGV